MLLKRTFMIMIAISLLATAAAAPVGVSKDEWSRLVFRYFLAASENASATGSREGLNIYLEQLQINNMLTAQERFDQGAEYAQVEDSIVAESVDIEKYISLKPSVCDEGQRCKTKHHLAYLDIHCEWSQETYCPGGCRVGSCIADPCATVVCDPSYCEKGIMYGNVICVEGVCDYTKLKCPASCNAAGTACQMEAVP